MKNATRPLKASQLGSQADRALSINAVRESLTLLKNGGSLPLSTSVMILDLCKSFELTI